MLSHRQIRYFLSIAETGQVSAAARLLNVSQSAMSLSLKDMEAFLGVSLFDRLPSGLRLTKAGHQFFRHARDIEASFVAAEQSVRDDQSHVSGEVRLGMSSTLSSYFAFPVLARFRRQYPNVTLHLSEHARPALEARLLGGALDMALVLTSNVTAGAQLRTATFHKSSRHLWVSADHPLTRLKQVTLKEVAAHPYALLRSDDADRQGMAHWTQETGQPEIAFTSSSIEAVRNIVAMGQAVTILSDVVYRPWTLDGHRVEKIKLADPVPSMDVGIAWPKQDRLTGAARLLRAAFTS